MAVRLRLFCYLVFARSKYTSINMTGGDKTRTKTTTEKSLRSTVICVTISSMFFADLTPITLAFEGNQTTKARVETDRRQEALAGCGDETVAAKESQTKSKTLNYVILNQVHDTLAAGHSIHAPETVSNLHRRTKMSSAKNIKYKSMGREIDIHIGAQWVSLSAIKQ